MCGPLSDVGWDMEGWGAGKSRTVIMRRMDGVRRESVQF